MSKTDYFSVNKKPSSAVKFYDPMRIPAPLDTTFYQATYGYIPKTPVRPTENHDDNFGFDFD